MLKGVRRWGLVAALLALCASPAGAQGGDGARGGGGLTLRGSIRSVTFEEDASTDFVRLELRYELVNTGQTAAIIWKHEPVFTGLTLARAPSFAPEEVLDAYRGGPSISTAPSWAEARKALDQPQPPAGLTEILPPNASSSFDASVHIVCPKEPAGGSLRRPSLKELREAGTVWLRVYYQMWSWNLEPDVRRQTELNFGRELQRRWKSFGELRLEDVYSEPIRLDLKDAGAKADLRP
jgi:hypothetical protein